MVAILERAGQLDQQITSSEVIREVAQRGGVQNVLLGSFMKVGETIRITIRLQDADSGSILASEMAEGEGESSIFPLVDDLSNRIKNTCEIPQAAEMELNRDIEDVTTASLEAYRQYAEGIRLKDEGQEREAIPWLERAVEIDPNFAMAYAKLSVIHGNNSRLTESEDYAQKALDHADRLPARERYYIEGLYYSKASGSAPRAIEAYLRLLEFYPDHTAARHNLGLQYQQLNRLDEAIEQYERLMQNNDPPVVTYGNLSNLYAARSQFEKGFEVITKLISRQPEIAAGHRYLANHLVQWVKLEEAKGALEKVESLAPGDPSLAASYSSIALLEEDWQKAESFAEQALASTDPLQKYNAGPALMAVTRFLQGKSEAALEGLAHSIELGRNEPPFGLFPVPIMSKFLRDLARPSEALELVQNTSADGQPWFMEASRQHELALTLAMLGRAEESEEAATRCKQLFEAHPGPTTEPSLQRFEGELALIAGDATLAVEKLEAARGGLTPHGLNVRSEHTLVSYLLASAYVAIGQDEAALKGFQTVVDTTSGHLNEPISYARSFYFMAKLHEQRGESDLGREYFRRFLSYWQQGDMDRERISEAEQKVR